MYIKHDRAEIVVGFEKYPAKFFSFFCFTISRGNVTGILRRKISVHVWKNGYKVVTLHSPYPKFSWICFLNTMSSGCVATLLWP